MKFTFFLKDESIHEIDAPDKDAAMRLLCDKLGKPWYWTRREIDSCLSPAIDPASWHTTPADKICCELIYSGDYIITHWTTNRIGTQFVLHYRPKGEHHHLGDFETLEDAKQGAASHAAIKT